MVYKTVPADYSKHSLQNAYGKAFFCAAPAFYRKPHSHLPEQLIARSASHGIMKNMFFSRGAPIRQRIVFRMEFYRGNRKTSSPG
jgi:hypothetical protein